MPTLKNGSNRLLASLPEDVHARLREDLSLVTLALDEVLYRRGESLSHVYFPLDCLVAKVCLSSDGKTASIGLIGHEGIVGLSSFLSGVEASAEARVVGAGTALRLSSRVLAEEFARGSTFQMAMLNFTRAFFAQTGQIAVCNRHHNVTQQLCFWLLLLWERRSGDELRITQDALAGLVGVRREGITEGALKLKEQGLIDYARGRIVVNDEERIKQLACECYHIVRNVYETSDF